MWLHLSHLDSYQNRKKDLGRLALWLIVIFCCQEFKPHFNLNVARQRSSSRKSLAKNQGKFRGALCNAGFHDDEGTRCDKSCFPLWDVYKGSLPCESCYIESDKRAF